MKANISKKGIIPLVSALALFIAACGGTESGGVNGQTIEGGKYVFELDTSGYSVAVNVMSDLPRPRVLDENGNDVSECVEVEVLYEDGSVYIPAHPLWLYDGFLPALEGRYDVYYSVTDNGVVRHRQAIEITAVKPVRKDDVKIDGVLDDEIWRQAPAYSTGVGGNMSVACHFAEDGLYLGVDVEDATLCYSDYIVSRLTQSDGFEICFDLAGEPDDVLNDACYKIAVSLCGEVAAYGASKGYTLYERLERIAPEYKLQIHGTRSLVGGGGSLSSKDRDEGYTLEMFLPFDQLGVKNIPERVGVAFAHRDVTTVDAGAAADGKAGNTRFTSVVLPANIKQILMNNGFDYYVDKYDNFAFTRMYETLCTSGDKNGEIGGKYDA